MTLTRKLLNVYERLLLRHGPQHWWPADGRFEVMVGAVLTQSAAWANVRKAVSNLKAAGALSPEPIRSLRQEDLAQLVYPSGYFNSKARKLKALADFLGRRFDDDLDSMAAEETNALRAELLDVYGIGEETADDILLYAVAKPIFVIDAYTRRVFSRLGLAPDKGSYSAYQSLFMDNLDRDVELFKEFHALIVRHGKVVCRKVPLCEGCCLLDICPTGESSVGPSA
ncbi:MAG: endonuclease III domain-containing protein [SAR202 cluster bacterium]|nr:endonuclease III domain-containing protein [SAR202 cluster bacterium]